MGMNMWAVLFIFMSVSTSVFGQSPQLSGPLYNQQNQLQAWDRERAKELDPIYASTKKFCEADVAMRSVGHRLSHGFFNPLSIDIATQSSLQAAHDIWKLFWYNPDPIINGWNQGFMSDRLAEFIYSKGFLIAMGECYGEVENWYFPVAMLAMSDWLGKVAVVVPTFKFTKAVLLPGLTKAIGKINVAGAQVIGGYHSLGTHLNYLWWFRPVVAYIWTQVFDTTVIWGEDNQPAIPQAEEDMVTMLYEKSAAFVACAKEQQGQAAGSIAELEVRLKTWEQTQKIQPVESKVLLAKYDCQRLLSAGL